MNRCRTAPLLAWLLLVPPPANDPAGKYVDPSRPLAEWIRIGEYADQAECDAQRLALMRMIAASSPASDLARRLAAGKCVEK